MGERADVLVIGGGAVGAWRSRAFFSAKVRSVSGCALTLTSSYGYGDFTLVAYRL